MKSFLLLGTEELRRVAAGVRSGRVRPPFSAVGLSQILSGSIAEKVASDLSSLVSSGLEADQIAMMLEIVADDREQRPSETRVDLVSSGPEAPGVTNRDTRVVVSQLFGNAEKSVIVAGYAVYQGRRVFESLAKRMDEVPDLRVQMFLDIQRKYRDTTGAVELVRRFAGRFVGEEWPGGRRPDLYYDPRSLELEPVRRASLHAKCIVVDGRTSFISSANFTEAAQLRNIEVGVLIDSPSFARQCVSHFQTLIAHGLVERVPLGREKEKKMIEEEPTVNPLADVVLPCLKCGHDVGVVTGIRSVVGRDRPVPHPRCDQCGASYRYVDGELIRDEGRLRR